MSSSKTQSVLLKPVQTLLSCRVVGAVLAFPHFRSHRGRVKRQQVHFYGPFLPVSMRFADSYQTMIIRGFCHHSSYAHFIAHSTEMSKHRVLAMPPASFYLTYNFWFWGGFCWKSEGCYKAWGCVLWSVRCAKHWAEGNVHMDSFGHEVNFPDCNHKEGDLVCLVLSFRPLLWQIPERMGETFLSPSQTQQTLNL